MDVALSEVASRLGGDLKGEGALRIGGVATLETATPNDIAFLANPLYARQLATTRAGCVIVAPAFESAVADRCAAIVVDDPYASFARLTQWWAAMTRPPQPAGIHPTADIAGNTDIAEDATIGAFAVIASGVSVGAGAEIGAHGVVGRDCSIGEATRLEPRVTLMAGTTIGRRCLVHGGAVLGADGFGFAPSDGRWIKIEQLGRLSIGDDVEIGANTCIDRGAVGDTVIGNGVKIDNLVQIGHNVRIGEHTAIAGCVGIAGSTTIGSHCMIGGGAGFAGHITIADHVVVGGATQVSSSIPKAGFYSGSFPFDDNAAWVKNAAILRNLHTLRDRVRALENKRS